MFCYADGSDAMSNISSNDDAESTSGSGFKVRIMFPAISMMDLSENRIQEVPQNIHELVPLSFFLSFKFSFIKTKFKINTNLLIK